MEEEYDEKLRLEREKLEESSREERIKAREAIRELRAQRAYERDMKSTIQRSRVSKIQKLCLTSLRQKMVDY